jgi:hypothetical protein
MLSPAYFSQFIKTARPRWVKELRSGRLSPENLARITSQMEPGQARFVRNLGQGSFNLADQMAGNVGGEQGLLVRKLQLHKLTKAKMMEEAAKALEASQHLEKISPGLAAQILDDGRSGAKGIWQQFGNKDVVPGWRGNAPKQGPELWHSTYDPVLKNWAVTDAERKAVGSARDVFQPLRDAGVADIRPPNLGPGGQLIDYQLKLPGWRSRQSGGDLEVVRSGRIRPEDVFRKPGDPAPIPNNALHDIVGQLFGSDESKRQQDAVRKYWLGKDNPMQNMPHETKNLTLGQKLYRQTLGKGGVVPQAVNAAKNFHIDPKLPNLVQGAGIGSALGAYLAPQGHKFEGARRGAYRGVGTSVGARIGREFGAATGTRYGRLIGTLLGGGAGYGGTGALIGKPSWKKQPAAAAVAQPASK